MKKIIFILSIFLSQALFAQDKTHFGVKVGYVNSSINNTSFQSSFDYTTRKMFCVGFAYNRTLTKIVDLQIEPIYTFKGYKLKSVDVIYSYNSSFIELPVLLKLHTNTGKLRPFINGGMAPAFNISDQYNAFKPFDLGLIGSVGFDIPITKNVYTFLELRGNLGLLKSHRPLHSNSEYNNRCFYVMTGLFF